jgi:hypothetical protein
VSTPEDDTIEPASRLFACAREGRAATFAAGIDADLDTDSAKARGLVALIPGYEASSLSNHPAAEA